MSADRLSITGQRLWDGLKVSAGIGAWRETGLRRLALTDEDEAMRDIFVGWAKDLGCTVEIDFAGNIFARRVGTEPELPAVCIGSHLDSQICGGRDDGVLRADADGGKAQRAVGARIIVAVDDLEGNMRLRTARAPRPTSVAGQAFSKSFRKRHVSILISGILILAARSGCEQKSWQPSRSRRHARVAFWPRRIQPHHRRPAAMIFTPCVGGVSHNVAEAIALERTLSGRQGPIARCGIPGQSLKLGGA